MVKGITRQVVVVKGAEPELFEQAIFLVRENALTHGGVSEEALLRQARQACSRPQSSVSWGSRFFWAGGGAAVTGLFWLLSALI